MSISEIMGLSSAEKILLVEQIWDSIETSEIEISNEQKKELDRRMSMDEKGQMSWHSWSEVKSHLQSKRNEIYFICF